MRQIILKLTWVLLLTACLQEPPDEIDPTEDPTTEPTSAIGTEEPTPTDAPIPTDVSIPTVVEPSPAPAEPVLKLGKGSVRETSLSPNGQLLLVASEAETILYQIEPWQVLWSLPTAPVPFEDRWEVRRTTIGWSADGTEVHLLDDYQLTTFDAHTGIVLHSFTFPDLPITAAFSQKGDRLAIYEGSDKERTSIWDVRTGQQVQVFEKTYQGYGIAWSPDGTIVASGPSLWNVATGEKIRDFAQGVGEGDFCCYIDKVVISPDGRLAATTGGRLYASDGVVNTYDAATGAFLSGWHLDNSTAHIAFTADSREVVYTDDSNYVIRFVDPYSGLETRTIAGAGALQFHSNGTLIATPSDAVQILDAQTGALRAELGGYSWYPDDAAYSPDGSLVATTSLTRVNLWDAHTGEWKRAFAPAHIEAGLSWSPDSRLLAVGGKHPMIWDVQTGQLIHELDDGTPRPFRHSLVAFSPRGDLLAATAGSFIDEFFTTQETDEEMSEEYWDYGDGDRVLVWGTDGRLLQTIMLEGTVSALAWSPDGTILSVSWTQIEVDGDNRYFSPKGTLWNIDTGERITEWDWNVGFWPSPILWSPDSRILASISSLGLWDAQTGSQLYTFETRSCDGSCWGNLDVFAFNRDGSAIMGIAYDLIHVWSTSTGELIYREPFTIAGYDASVNFDGLAIAPNWSQITLSYYNEIFLVPISPFDQ
jgi:hypothetical protein